jgi:hypothetical protein
MGKRGLGLGVFAAVVGAASAAQATPLWRLVYVREGGAERCPEEMELRMAVAARLGRDPFSSGASGAVVAHIAARADELLGSVELVDDAGISRGKRELRAGAATCDDMARAVALSISIAVDPERALAVDGEDPPPRTGEGSAPSRPHVRSQRRSEPREPSRDRVPSRPEPSERYVSFSAAALSVWGIAPAPAWGGTIRFQRRLGWLAFGAGALAATSLGDQIHAVGRLDTSLAAAEIEACALRGVLEACAVGLAGATWARAGDVALPRTDVGRFLAAGGRVGFAVPVSPLFGIFAEASLVGVWSPVRATVDGAEVWKAPPFAVALGVGARFRFL